MALHLLYGFAPIILSYLNRLSVGPYRDHMRWNEHDYRVDSNPDFLLMVQKEGRRVKFVMSFLICVGSGLTSSVFEIHLNQCGTTSSGTSQNDGQPNPVGSFVESTIIVQVIVIPSKMNVCLSFCLSVQT